MDAKSLRDQADKARAEADSRRRLASLKQQNSAGHADTGFDRQAEAEQDEAKQLAAQVAAFERQADEFEHQAEEQERKANELDAEEQRVRSEYESKLKQIDDQRRQLRGE